MSTCVSFGKFRHETYEYVYETQKWYVNWVISLGHVENPKMRKLQEYFESQLRYDMEKCRKNVERFPKRSCFCSNCHTPFRDKYELRIHKCFVL